MPLRSSHETLHEERHPASQIEELERIRYTDEGRPAEEWVRTDTYNLLRQLGGV